MSGLFGRHDARPNARADKLSRTSIGIDRSPGLPIAGCRAVERSVRRAAGARIVCSRNLPRRLAIIVSDRGRASV